MAKSQDSLNFILSSKAHAFSVASLISPAPMDETDEDNLPRYAYPNVSSSPGKVKFIVYITSACDVCQVLKTNMMGSEMLAN